jgi:hypothetical protein
MTNASGGLDTTIYCTQAILDQWKVPDDEGKPLLAQQWQRHYPQLFDDEDFENVKVQALMGFHFAEWYTTIHLFQRNGARSLIERYDAYELHASNQLRQNHQSKVREFERIVPEAQRETMHDICGRLHVGAPDLFVIELDGSFRFAEVKGPNDGSKNRQPQVDFRKEVWEDLGIPTELVEVKILNKKG